MNREDMQGWLKVKNWKQIRLGSRNNTIEDSCNIENQISNNVLLKRKLSVGYFQNNT